MPSITSSLVIPRPDTPLIWMERFNAAASNQPQRRGRPVVAPNSLPRLASCLPTASSSSVGNGPEPTRVV